MVIGKNDVRCVRTFWPLDDFEIDTISLFQRSVAVTRNVGVMDENVRTVISPDKAVPLESTNHFTLPCTGTPVVHNATPAQLLKQVPTSVASSVPNNSFLSCSFFASHATVFNRRRSRRVI